jgi:hypothetical protein
MRKPITTLAEAVVLLSRGAETTNEPEDRMLVVRYLSHLAPLLAEAVLERDIREEIEGVERLFGHTWLIDQSPFLPAFEKWRQFRDEYERSVAND